MKRILGICSGLVILVAASVAIGQDREPQDPGAGPRRAEGRPDRGGPEGRERRPEMLMVLLDKDRDGALSADEISAAADVLRALDKNEDGVVSADELRPRRPERGPGERGDRPEGGEGRRNGGRGGFIMRYDTNEDGFVTREEYAAGMDEQFNRLDKNQDGKIDAEEAASGFGGGGGPEGRGGRGGRDGEAPRERQPRQP
jgi:Ca2+-binding EF-hand superfamily protein